MLRNVIQEVRDVFPSDPPEPFPPPEPPPLPEAPPPPEPSPTESSIDEKVHGWEGLGKESGGESDGRSKSVTSERTLPGKNDSSLGSVRAGRAHHANTVRLG